MMKKIYNPWLIMALALALVSGMFTSANALTVTDTGSTVLVDTGGLAMSVPMGAIGGAYAVNKYGLAVDGVQQAGSDIWDRANASATQNTWLAPTAARVHTIVSTSANDVCAKGTLTLTGQPADTNTLTVGSKVYVMQTTLTDVDGNVKIGASASATIDNIVAAINLAAGAGTTYAASMTTNADTTVAVNGAGDTMVLWDQLNGLIATTETMDNTTWGGAVTVAGTGAVGLRVSYLPTWGTKETTEDVILHGDVGVAMTNSAVMINRMKVIDSGAQYNENAGIITATAASDSTVSAAIIVGAGQTLMAIYGIPSTQTAYLTSWHVDSHDTANPGTATEVDFTLLVNEAPDVDPTTFLNKSNIGTLVLGNSHAHRFYNPYNAVSGPAIIKVRGVSTVDDAEGSAEFDLYLLDN